MPTATSARTSSGDGRSKRSPSIDAGDRALLEAYAAGANAALAAMRARPFEYWLLRQTPEPWRAEDCLLVVYAMWIDLQGLEARHEQRRGRLAAALPRGAVPIHRRAGSRLGGARSTAASSPQMPMPTRRGIRSPPAGPQSFRGCGQRRRQSRQAALADRRARRDGRQQQLGGRGLAHRRRRGARRERHASRPQCAEHLVPGALRDRGRWPRRQRREPARRARDHRRQQWPHRLGIHEQLRRFPGSGPCSSGVPTARTAT